MKKALHALQIIGDSKFGGDSLVVCDWLQMLQSKGIKTTLLATDPLVVDLAKSRGLDVWTFKGVQRSINPLVDVPAVFRLAKGLKKRFDIVHTNTTKGGAIGRPASWLSRIPIVVHTVHGFAFHEHSGAVATWAISGVERTLTRMCDRVVFVNNYDREQAIAKGIVPENKAVTVYNGVSEERIAPGLSSNKEDILSELGLPSDAFLSVFVGRLAEQKGLKYLFEAISILKNRSPSVNFHQVLVGNGEQEEQCRQWVESFGISDRVHFLGFRKDSLRYTGAADLFVLSSLWEGHSITLLEAMGCGRPIVATDIKGNRESITDGKDGILVKPADPVALAQGILRAVEDKNLSMALGDNARKTFDKRFTLKAMLENTWSVYEGLLEEKKLWPS